MLLLKLDSRQMERELKYNALSRLFVMTDRPTEGFVRDHANIDRSYRALGADGIEELNQIIIQRALESGFSDLETLNSDTTIQELHIGYPNEPGILRQVAQKVVRLGKRLLKAGFKQSKGAVLRVTEQATRVLEKVKEHRLFAKTKEDKARLLREMMTETEVMMTEATTLQLSCAVQTKSKVASRVGEKIRELQGFVTGLLPQIKGWLETKKVATQKLLHPGFAEARSHTKNKPGKKVEFGFKWLVNQLAGGYVYGQMFVGRPSESDMPLKALEEYREHFGEDKTPKMAVYDRGGWSKKNVRKLEEEGVQEVGLMPKGRADWCVGESEQVQVRSLRGQMEASIGTLKTECYGFNKPKQRSVNTVEQAGQRSFASKNLNKLMSDLIQSARASD